MAENGLRRGENGLQIYMMCEIPSNVILAEQFATRFDGFSIGSNDLTQLVLGVDRDSGFLASLFDERDEAVTRMIAEAIRKAHAAGIKRSEENTSEIQSLMRTSYADFCLKKT